VPPDTSFGNHTVRPLTAEGIRYQPGWVLGVTATLKIFIDISSASGPLLGYIWTKYQRYARSVPRMAEI
jgi:hypothetical protein